MQHTVYVILCVCVCVCACVRACMHVRAWMHHNLYTAQETFLQHNSVELVPEAYGIQVNAVKCFVNPSMSVC